MPRKRKRRGTLDFFEELEALESGFFLALEIMIENEAQLARDKAADKERRAQNALKAQRIFKRLKAVEHFDCWHATSHIVPDFFGSNRERVIATKILFEKRERIRWFLRTLYDHWMFDVPIRHNTKWLGYRYSRHRKWFLKRLREFKRHARKQKHVSREELRKQRKEAATKALDALRDSKAIRRLRDASDDDPTPEGTKVE